MLKPKDLLRVQGNQGVVRVRISPPRDGMEMRYVGSTMDDVLEWSSDYIDFIVPQKLREGIIQNGLIALSVYDHNLSKVYPWILWCYRKRGGVMWINLEQPYVTPSPNRLRIAFGTFLEMVVSGGTFTTDPRGEVYGYRVAVHSADLFLNYILKRASIQQIIAATEAEKLIRQQL